jgi:hypothetical protein
MINQTHDQQGKLVCMPIELIEDRELDEVVGGTTSGGSGAGKITMSEISIKKVTDTSNP